MQLNSILNSSERTIMEISESTSKRITSLRFLLMLLVMIKHNAIVKNLFMQELPFYEPTWITFIKEFFADGLGELAVPIFFIFSAYLLASSADSYISKLKKRFLSIFIPYTIWMVFYFFAWLFLKKMTIFTGVENPVMEWHKWTFRDYILRFLGYYQGLRFPFVGSFWFLRDLMVLILFSPILMISAKKLPFFTIITIFLAFLFNLLPPLLMVQSLFYFELGLIFAIYKIDFFVLCDKIPWHDLLIAFSVGFIFFFKTLNDETSRVLLKSVPYFLFVFSGIISLLKFSKLISENCRAFEFAQGLAPITFFVYAVHTPVLTEIVKNLTLRAKLPSIFQFIFACFLDIGFSILCALILRKISPSIFALLSGGNRGK